MEQYRLEGRVALVTGASRGIGSAIARRLAAEGAFVIINYQGSRERAEKVMEDILAAGGKGRLMQCDVSDSAACDAMIREIGAACGQLDILVNNAGINRDGLMMAMSDEAFEQVLQVNLMGAFHTIRAASRLMMKKRWGRIINLSSVSALMGNGGQANYAASKAGLIGLTKTCARELAARNITVNAIAPGFIETDMTAALPEKIRAAALAQIPAGRFADPGEVAALAAYLAGEESSYITGQVISINGGMYM